MDTDNVSSSEHLSQQTMSLLLNDELTPSQRSVARLHLSYCFICRSRRDELVLKLSAQRMWETFPSAHRDEQHIDDRTFESFWSGELRDEARLTEISRHCIACARCRERRELLSSKTKREHEFLLRTLLLAGLSVAWKRRRLLLVALPLGLLTTLIVLFAFNRPEPPQGDSSAYDRKPSAPSDKVDQAVNVSPKETPTPPTKDVRTNRSNLLARAQTIDLRSVSDGAQSRSPDDAGRESNRSFTMSVSGSGPTRFRFELPLNSKKGVYLVSIREPAFLQEIVPAKGRSRDGRSLSVSMNLSHLDEETYILRLERLTGRSSHKEYMGDYEVMVSKRSSKKAHRVR
jgi:hypothetical protein